MRFALFVWTVLVLASMPALAQDITGPARVIDGDTIEVAGQRIRIHGIDAPELNQTCWDDNGEFPCGRNMAQVMVSRSGKRPVTCREKLGCNRPGDAKARRHNSSLRGRNP